MPESPELRAHREWLGYVQPAGIVVSPPALIAAGAYADRNIHDVQRRLQECVQWIPLNGASNPVPAITDLQRFFEHVFGWEHGDLCGGDDLPASLEVSLTEYDEALRPEFAVRAENGANGDVSWQLLIDLVPSGTDLDAAPDHPGRNWDASPTARLERLCRELQVPIGLVCNGTHLRLMYAPRGETRPHDVPRGRNARGEWPADPLGPAHVLRAERMFSLPARQRLPAILEESRRYQAQVSTALSRQVLAALYELLRGFQTDNNSVTPPSSSARSFNPLQEGYTPVEKKGYTPSAPTTDGSLPPAPAGSTGQTPVTVQRHERAPEQRTG